METSNYFELGTKRNTEENKVLGALLYIDFGYTKCRRMSTEKGG